ncbi:PAQR family membrane homeostasis protein TrhA [Roseovarius aestuarii]|uniref:Hemolysin-III related n=1 Tax=Roseovarius aestuarii TaxID=475083 RepID=A0A1X7BLG4_9RHOB|nr:hemolysin III family protein [Roseovarius aestuarii]SMC10488.1 hemolysin-III related [Roseovarius aestuarii]
MSYPVYTRAERIADVAIHVLGVGAALFGVSLIFSNMSENLAGPSYVAACIYAMALVTMLTASATYHIAAYTPARPILRRIDHAAIYFKIAGTFTPLSVVLNTTFGYVVLAFVWALALWGAGSKLMAERGKMTTGWLPYVALGWIGVALFVPLVTVLPVYTLALVAAGGLLYTAGVVFYSWEGLRYANAIWHGFVLIASGCLFFAVSTALAVAG